MYYVHNCTATFTFFAHHTTTQFSHDQFLALARHGICTEYAPWRFHAIVMRVRRAQPTPHGGMANATATALLFRSGRVVLTGVRGWHLTLQGAIRRIALRVCRNVQLALRAAATGGRQQQRTADSLGVYRLTTCNLVSTLQVPNRLDIELLYAAMLLQRRRMQRDNANNGSQHVNDRDAGVNDDGGFSNNTAFVGVRRCCLDLSTFPALRCTLLMVPTGRVHEQQTQQQRCSVPVTCLMFISGRVIVTGVRHVAQMRRALQNITPFLANYER
uniref:TATA-box-binding protein n=1 Tax=Globodera pallida TaxID=36090 RepID=A0A183BP00_GLOPA